MSHSQTWNRDNLGGHLNLTPLQYHWRELWFEWMWTTLRYWIFSKAEIGSKLRTLAANWYKPQSFSCLPSAVPLSSEIKHWETFGTGSIPWKLISSHCSVTGWLLHLMCHTAQKMHLIGTWTIQFYMVKVKPIPRHVFMLRHYFQVIWNDGSRYTCGPAAMEGCRVCVILVCFKLVSLSKVSTHMKIILNGGQTQIYWSIKGIRCKMKIVGCVKHKREHLDKKHPIRYCEIMWKLYSLAL